MRVRHTPTIEACALRAAACVAMLLIATRGASASPADPPADAPPAAAMARHELAALRAGIDQLRQQLSRYEARLQELEAGLDESTPAGGESQTPRTAAARAPTGHHHAHHQAGPSPASMPVAGTASSARPSLGIAAKADVVGAWHRAEVDEGFAVRSATLSAQGQWTPEIGALLMLGVEPSGAVHVEQAYARLSTPNQLLAARLGRLRAAFGQVNARCTDELPWVDRPLVFRNLLHAGHGPVTDTGASLAVSGRGLMAVFEVFRGDSVVFRRSAGAGPAWGGRVAARRSTARAAFDLGTSVMRGPGGTLPGSSTTFVGLDGGIVAGAVTVLGEWMLGTERPPAGGDLRASGGFLALDWQVAPTWTLGARADRSSGGFGRPAVDRAGDIVASWSPVEPVRLRAQFGLEQRADSAVAPRLLAQVTFRFQAGSSVER